MYAVGHEGTILKAVSEPVGDLFAGLDDPVGPGTGSEDIVLHGNCPNPFTSAATISYELPEMAKVDLRVYNILGQEVRTLISSTQSPGRKSTIWDGRDSQGQLVGSGVYLCTLKVGSDVETKKMMLLR